VPERICSAPECNRPVGRSARGLCPRCYKRWYRHGSTSYPTQPVEPRFWPKVDKTETCWLWNAGTNGVGYGMFWVDKDRGRVLAHRYAYELLVGPIPEGLTLDHLCRQPTCVRPDHLEPVTHRENVRRGNGWGGRKARQTHCLRGHELTEANIYRKPSRPTSRECRTCMAEREAKRLRRR
jgi:hypothetical protein